MRLAWTLRVLTEEWAETEEQETESESGPGDLPIQRTQIGKVKVKNSHLNLLYTLPLKTSCLGTREVDQWLRTLAALAECSSSIHIPSITSVLGVLMPSAGPHRHCMLVVHRDTDRQTLPHVK